tara:strand:+ start:196 stop:1044 length:849 start_codon:yes stop_codon:yes gene_type:complete
MKTVLYEKDGLIGRVTLNRPEKLNAINDDMPRDLEEAITLANDDPDVSVIILSGNGKAFCSGYDLSEYAQGNESNKFTQKMPWDPIKDYQTMWNDTQHFMSIWKSLKPVICKVHGFAIAGGSDIALCSDMIIMADNAEIGYMPSRVWGTPTTAMWVHRIGPEKAKKMLFTGDKINGKEAEKIGLVLESVSPEKLDERVEALANRIKTVPINQLAMQKMVINQYMETSGITQMQRLSTIFDGISRHSPEGIQFQKRVEEKGWKEAVRERDQGLYDWSKKKKFD